MSKSMAVFDYASLDKDTKGKLVALAGEIKRYGESFRKCGMQVGEAVFNAHLLLADHRDGLFEKWVEQETDIGLSTAYNLKNVWERASDFPILENLPPTVAYLLAAPKTPDAAIKAVEKAVNKGTRPTVELAKAAIKEHSEPRAARPPRKPPSQSDMPATPAEDDPGPQRGPASVPQIEAQAKQAARELDDAKPVISGGGTFKPEECETAANVGKLFSELLEHFRQSVLLIDKIKAQAPNAARWQDVFDSLECANTAVIEWRKKARAA